jgi:hypothetical protein
MLNARREKNEIETCYDMQGYSTISNSPARLEITLVPHWNIICPEEKRPSKIIFCRESLNISPEEPHFLLRGKESHQAAEHSRSN